MEREIYFDNSATTRVHPAAGEKMLEMMLENYGNPSSLHRKGIQAEQAMTHARKIMAKALQVHPEEIFFTSGGTESNNLAIKGLIHAYRNRGNHIITTNVEHPSVLNVCERLEEAGIRVTYLPVRENGVIEISDLRDALTEETILVSIMHVNNETGAIQPIQEAAKLVKSWDKKIFFHVDAVQSFGKLEVLPGKWGVDLLSVSGHKLHGPEGIGMLYVKKGTRLIPLLEGGGQERKLRSGTENLPGIAGMGKATELALDKLPEHYKKLKLIKEKMVALIQENISDCRINSNFDDWGVPHILNISFPGTRSEVLLHYLEQNGVYVSAGSACSAKKGQFSHVLTAMGRSETEMEGSLRFSFSYLNEPEEVLPAAESLVKAVKEIKNLTGR